MARQRTVMGPAGRPCLLCGDSDVVVVQSRAVRSGWNRLRPRWDARSHTYDECRSCGAKGLE